MGSARCDSKIVGGLFLQECEQGIQAGKSLAGAGVGVLQRRPPGHSIPARLPQPEHIGQVALPLGDHQSLPGTGA